MNRRNLQTENLEVEDPKVENLKDKELLEQTKFLAQSERQILTKILHHLREVNRRRLFSDLGYKSLFEYSVKELKYSEGQAGRRIQAMRLIQEIPEIEQKIEGGSLNLINVCQAQRLFKEAEKVAGSFSKIEKLDLLGKLENKSKLEGQKIIEDVRPNYWLGQKSEIKIKISISDDLKSKLSEVRSLLGYKGSQMSLDELIIFMANHTIEAIKVKKFGKKRIMQGKRGDSLEVESKESRQMQTPPVESRRARHIPRQVKFEVWKRDLGKCRKCGGTSNLNYDHVHPVALGGASTIENLRLLCFSCNQRRSYLTFGKMAESNRRIYSLWSRTQS